MNEDLELISYVRESSEEAYYELINKYKRLININIQKINSHINHSELYTEGLIALVSAIDSYREDKDFALSTYVNKCIHNRIINYVKSYNKNQDNNNLSIEKEIDDGITLADVISSSSNFEKQILDKDEYNELTTNLKKTLSPKELQICEFLIKGYNYDDIASKLNITKKSIYNSINRIKNKWQNIIKD